MPTAHVPQAVLQRQTKKGDEETNLQEQHRNHFPRPRKRALGRVRLRLPRREASHTPTRTSSEATEIVVLPSSGLAADHRQGAVPQSQESSSAADDELQKPSPFARVQTCTPGLSLCM